MPNLRKYCNQKNLSLKFNKFYNVKKTKFSFAFIFRKCFSWFFNTFHHVSKITTEQIFLILYFVRPILCQLLVSYVEHLKLHLPIVPLKNGFARLYFICITFIVLKLHTSCMFLLKSNRIPKSNERLKFLIKTKKNEPPY